MKNKRLLMLAYYYPPFAGVASQRSNKFRKYLPEHDWDPVIYTVDERYYGGRVVFDENYTKSDNQSAENSVVRVGYINVPFSIVIIKLLYPLLALWYIIRHRREFDAVYMSGSPYHPFLLTTIVTGLLHIPTVIDFRDSWSINHGYDGSRAVSIAARVREKFCQLIEAISIRFASQVVFATSKLQSEYMELFPEWGYKFSTIHNGVDPEDLVAVTPERKFSGTTLFLAGKIYIYTPEVIDILMQVLKDTPDLSFLYVGEEHGIIEEAAQRYNLERQVTALPFQPHKRVLDLMAGSDIGLVTTGMTNGLGTKIFEYLALGKPAVCLVPEASIIGQEFRCTSSVIISHPPHTADKIKKIVCRALNQSCLSFKDDFPAFNRKNSTSELTNFLEKITAI